MMADRRNLRPVVQRAWGSRHESLWLLGLLLAALALVAILLNGPTVWIGDNRFELYQNPGRRLSRMLSIWDPSRGTGRLRADFWPGVTLPIALLRLVGFSVAVTEHLWHAALLTSGGIGSAAFVRRFVPRIGLAHVVCALLYMFGPYSVGFLLPSNLYLNYAIAPWIFVLFHRGVHADDRWRWAAGLALLVFAAGNTEVAGLIYAFAYLVPLAIHVAVVDRTTTWRRIGGWVLRFGVLAVGISAVAVFTSIVGTEVFDQNLRETEAADVLNGNSSWAESWRGLGSWLLYHRDVTGFSRPQTLVYLSAVAAIVASFVPAALAVAGVAWSRHRARLLFGSMMLMGLVLMVGIHPLADPPPYGQGLDWAYEHVPNVSILRNNYKAGSGMILGTAALSGLMVAQIATALRRRVHAFAAGRTSGSAALLRAGRAGGWLVLGLFGATLSQPFWQGELYNPAWELEEVPGYVTEATAWLDEQPPGSRVLVLPRAYRNGFRWGWVNDDVLDAFVARPHVVEVPIHLSRPVPADLISAVDRALVDRIYRQGDISHLAAAVSADLVMIRNDHDWDRWDQPRPADYDDLRSDPALELTATFGAPGQNTTAVDDVSATAARERDLPPIEVYRVADPTPIVRVTGPSAELLVSGDGEAIPLLGRSGLLDPGRATAFTGDLDGDQLIDALDRGSALIITDTNRRRVEVITTAAEQSYTLAEGQRLDREPFELFDAPGAESVAAYGDVASVRATGSVAFTGGLQPWHRPSNAVDGDPETTWLVGGLVDPRGERFRLDFVEPTDISGVRLLAADPAGGLDGLSRRLAGVRIALSDGTVAAAELVDGRYELDLSAADIEWIDLTVTRVEGVGLAPVGIAEFTVLGADTVERIVAPQDVARRADDDAELARSLETATVGYLFGRSVGEGPVDEERRLRRSFVALRDDEVALTGELRVSVDTPEDLLSLLAQTGVRARGDARLLGNPNFTGARAVDGDRTTGWVAPPAADSTLRLDFSRRTVETVVVRLRVGQGLSTVREVTVEVAGESFSEPLSVVGCASSAQCEAVVTIDLPAVEVDRLSVIVTDIDATGQNATNPIRIDEVEINGEVNPPAGDADGRLDRCLQGLVEIDGQSVPVRLLGSVEAALRGQPVGFVGCATVNLDRGPRSLSSGDGIIVDRALLLPTTGLPDVQSSDNTVVVQTSTPTSWTLDVDAPEGGWLLLGQSAHPAWEARLDGVDLGPSAAIDTVAAWRLPPGSSGTVEVRFAWQRWFEASLAISLLTATLCGWLVLRRVRPEGRA